MYVFQLFYNDVSFSEHLNLYLLGFPNKPLLIYWIQLLNFFIKFMIQVSALIVYACSHAFQLLIDMVSRWRYVTDNPAPVGSCFNL